MDVTMYIYTKQQRRECLKTNKDFTNRSTRSKRAPKMNNAQMKNETTKRKGSENINDFTDDTQKPIQKKHNASMDTSNASPHGIYC